MRAFLPLPPLGNGYVTGIGSGLICDESMVAELAEALKTAENGESTEFEITNLIYGRVLALVAEVNSQFFRFDLSDFTEPDEPCIVRHVAGPCRLEEATLSESASTRKLTVLLPILTPPSSRLVVDGFGKSTDITPGSGIVLPSYLIPVLDLAENDDRNEFLGIMMHVHGPAFR